MNSTASTPAQTSASTPAPSPRRSGALRLDEHAPRVHDHAPAVRENALRVHERLLDARRGQRKADFQLAMLLAELADDNLFLELGYCSLANYAEQVLELTPRTTRELLLLGRRLPGLPVVSASVEAGELDWTKAREIVRVATPATEAAWVDRAASLTSRALEAEVATSLVGDLPPTGQPDPERRPERQRVVFEMDSADAEVLRTALAAIRGVTHVGQRAAWRQGEGPGDGVLLAAMARRALVTLEEESAQFGGESHSGPTGEASSGPTGERYRVVLEHCPACRRTVAPDAEVSTTVAAEAMCDAEVLDMRPGPDQGHVTRSVPEVTRRKVFHRAGWKCEVPGCGNRLWLDVHHMTHRAAGGRNGLDNLAAVCSAHHRCIHDGALAVEFKCERAVGELREKRRVIEVTHADGRTRRTAGGR